MRKPKPFITDWSDVPVVVDIPYVADLFRISEERIRQMCVKGDIEAFKISGLWRISKKTLMHICGADDSQ